LREFGRVLGQSGAVVTASPGPDHLLGLKAVLYATPTQHPTGDDDPSDAASAQAPHSESRCTTRLVVRGEDAANLLAMTPFVWKASGEARAKVAAGELETPVDFRIRVYRDVPPC
jgi:23S rRNA (guanine745-N1)-methyltransferase